MAGHKLPIRRRPVIRVFVSSTFSDLKHERERLQTGVFKELERICAVRQFQFQAIDLRWGIPREASDDHRTMQICFKELERSQQISPQPNFLILLGNRYGWRPLPEEISVEEFERLMEKAKTDEDKRTLADWYQKDANAVPAVHVLRSLKDDFGKTTDQEKRARWTIVEAILWKIINRAYKATDLADRFNKPMSANDPLPPIVRFQASATEQEIWRGALQADDAKHHVFAYFREIDNIADFPVASQLKDFVDLIPGTNTKDQGPQTALAQLKAQLSTRLGKGNIIHPVPHARLERRTDGKGGHLVDVTTDHLPALCEWVLKKLTPVIEAQMDAYWGTGNPTPEIELAHERRAHADFGLERAPEDIVTNGKRKRKFVGRERLLDEIASYIESDSQQPLVLYGTSGCGKTAVMARAAQRAEQNGLSPIVRFLGVTPRSSDARLLLAMLCRELRRRHPLESALSSDLNEVIREFQDQLKTARPQQKYILFLDALDQLSDADNGRSVNWIPFGPLPDNVKLIVSCLSDRENQPGGEPYESLQRRKYAESNYKNLDSLSVPEATELLFDVWLPAAARKITTAQRSAIDQVLATNSARQPLYLKILFEECKLWRSSDTVPTRIGDDVPKLLESLLIRLAKTANHGRLLPCALGYIASAHRGLTELEILEVLYKDKEYKKHLDGWTTFTGHQLPDDPKRIPIVLWSRLRFDLSPYISEQGAPGGSTVLNFYHRQVGEFFRDRLLGHNTKKLRRHERLADYFHSLDFWWGSLVPQGERAKRVPRAPRPVNVRKIDELPWQRLQAAKLGGGNDPKSQYWDKVADLLTSWEFLEAKTEAVA